MDRLTVSTGRDYRHSVGYEYCVFDGDTLIERAGPFKNNAQAKRHGAKRAADIIANPR